MKKWIKIETGMHEGLSMQTLKAKYAGDYYRDSAIMVRLLALAGKIDSDGELRQGDGSPMTTLQLGIMTGLPATDISAAIADLSDDDIGIMGTADDGAYRFSAWGRYQEKSRTEYQRGYRASKAASDSTRIDDLFDQWWAIYPKKVAKGAAKKAWAKLAKSGVALDQVVAATQYLVDDPAYAAFHCDQQYIPYPATWINGGRYEDAVGGDA